MNSSTEQTSIRKILSQVQRDFYADQNPRLFYRDRSALILTITWPAIWLSNRGLQLPPSKYETIVLERLHEVRKHGDPKRYRQYLPRYLMRCIQQWFVHNGDNLCDELRHMKNQLWQADTLIQALQAHKPPSQHAYTQNLCAAHLIIQQRKRPKKTCNPKQMTLL